MYKGHRFRIRAATHVAQQGFSENCTQKIGRQNSDDVRRYACIGLQSFVTGFHAGEKSTAVCIL